MELSRLAVLLMLMSISLSLAEVGEQVQFTPASVLDEQAFLKYYLALERLESEDWVTDLADLSLNAIFEELQQIGGGAAVARLLDDSATEEELKQMVPLVGHRWVDIAAVRRFVGAVTDKDRGDYLSFHASSSEFQGRVLAVFDESPGLPHFLFKLYNLSNPFARGEAIAKLRLYRELQSMADLLTQFTVSKPLKSWACTGEHCSLADDVPGLIEVVEVFSGYRLTDLAARVSESTVEFPHFLEACAKAGSALGQLHQVSMRRTVAGPDETALDQYWNEDHVNFVLQAATLQLGTGNLDTSALAEALRRLRVEAGPQPYFSMIHGDPSLEHMVFPNNFFDMRSAMHLAGWRYGGAYIGFEPRPGGLVRRRFLGAPEFDYHLFLIDLEHHLLGLNFYNDEIEEAVAAFKRSYCLSFHLAVDESWRTRGTDESKEAHGMTCDFPSPSFEEYCSFLARLQLTEDYPERAAWFFPEFVGI